MKRFQFFLLTLFVALAAFACGSKPAEEQHAHESEAEHGEEESVARGPHGGRLLGKNDFELEITIFEAGMPPHFLVYPYENKKPVDPDTVQLSMELHRLGGEVDRFHFRKEGDHLRGDAVVEEPHSFDVRVLTQHEGKQYDWKYSQIEGRVELTPEQISSAGIEVQTAGPAIISSRMQLPGEVILNRDRTAHVVPGIAGIVTESRKSQGESVKAGEILAVLQSRELAELRSDYLAANERVALARATYEREERLFQKKISPEQDLLAAKQGLAEAEINRNAAAQKLLALGIPSSELSHLSRQRSGNMNLFAVRAPLSGVIIEKNVSPGESIQQDADIFLIADLSTVWVDVTVYAKDLNLVRTGQKVRVSAESTASEGEGTLTYIGPLIGEQTRTAKARVVLPNQDHRWRPGLFVTVDLMKEEVNVPVTVSSEAIQTYRDWNVVFARFGNFFEVRPVEIGRKDNQAVEILEGVQAGQEYASKNSFILKAELGKAAASHEH